MDLRGTFSFSVKTDGVLVFAGEQLFPPRSNSFFNCIILKMNKVKDKRQTGKILATYVTNSRLLYLICKTLKILHTGSSSIRGEIYSEVKITFVAATDPWGTRKMWGIGTGRKRVMFFIYVNLALTTPFFIFGR